MVRIFLVLIIFLSQMHTSLACSCDAPDTVAEAFENTPFIFHSKVISKKYVTFKASMNAEGAKQLTQNIADDQRMSQMLDAPFVVEVQMEILERFKDTFIDKTVTLFTTRTSASCGFTRFEIGQEYIVYSSSKSYAFSLFNAATPQSTSLEKPNTYWTNHCTLTSEFYPEVLTTLRGLKKDAFNTTAFETTIQALLSKGLINPASDDLHIQIIPPCSEVLFGQFEINGYPVQSSANTNNGRQPEIIIKTIQILHRKILVECLTFGEKGTEYISQITLAKEKEKFKLENISTQPVNN